MSAINIIFDGPPAHESGRFVEVEDDNGNGLGLGEWIERDDGCWALRIQNNDRLEALKECLEIIEKEAKLFSGVPIILKLQDDIQALIDAEGARNERREVKRRIKDARMQWEGNKARSISTRRTDTKAGFGVK